MSSASQRFVSYLNDQRPAIDAALECVLPPADAQPSRLHEAMRYAVFAGGKRFRPALLLATAERLGGDVATLGEPASALELIHTFSLVHDDLPALDDDDLRRGQPTVHVRYDEALAVLVGDALLSLGLELLLEHPRSVSARVRVQAAAIAARAIGSLGMIGGQVDDLDAESHDAVSPALLESIHRRKTGELLVASMRLAGLYAGADAEIDALLSRLGGLLGLIFQIGDDILDIESDAETLGKTAGKDVQANKLTYPRVYGLERSKDMLREAQDEALVLSRELPGDSAVHDSLIEFLVRRRH